MSKKRTFTEEYRVQIVKEVLETGENGVVARRHDIHPVMLSRWVQNFRKHGTTTVPTTYKSAAEINETSLSNENQQLKKLLGEKELEIQILKDLLKKTSQH